MSDSAPATAMEALALAKHHHQAGRLPEAREGYQNALSFDACNVESLFLLAMIDHQEGHTQAAADLLRKAIEVQPVFPQAYQALANIRFGRGDVQGAVACLRQGLDTSPGNVDLEIGLANMLVRAERLDEAIALYRSVLARVPQRPDLHNNLGFALDRVGQLDQALEAFGRALALNGNYVEAHANRASTLIKVGRPISAVDSYRKAIALKPDHLQACIELGKVLMDLGRTAEAIEAYRKVVELKPDDVSMYVTLANALASIERYAEALEVFHKVIDLKPNFAEMYANVGSCLNEMGRPQEAISAFRRALELDSRLEGAYNGLAIASMFLGDSAEARRAFGKAIALNPSNAFYHYNRSDFVKFTAESPELAALLELEKKNSVPVQQRAHFHLALAKAYNDFGQYADAWRHLTAGNALHRRSLNYDHPRGLSMFDRVRRQFSGDFVRRHERLGNPSSLPVFIIGMPRSGTSLLEQLLSGHREVFGAGELLDFGASITEIDAERGERALFPESVASLSPAGLAAVSTRYLDKIRALSPTASRITDKLPQNFFHAGLIHLALPNAAIIHIFRDAADTCISNLFRLFSSGHEYSYDPVELGQYYRAYQRLMNHWYEVLPPGRILDVRYEDVVADLEGQARRIVAHCGLGWDEGCLEFYKLKRPVITASATQVRQPIYDTSIGRWRNYERFLGPLLSELKAA